jgi:protein involved in polysaccharide export with SLBB domain
MIIGYRNNGAYSIMKKSFFNNLVILCALAFALGGQISAQPMQNPTTVKKEKRNNPYSPNPKKKEAAEQNIEAKKVDVEADKVVGEINPKVDENKIAENETQTENPSLAMRTREVVKRSAAKPKAITETYKIGVGDILDIRILNNANKNSSLFTVLEGGTIDYPLAGDEPIQVAGFTIDEISDLLKEKIKLYENPDVAVNVRDYASHTVSVLGLVEKAGTKALRREAIPLYVILAEAVPTMNANKVSIVRASDKQTVTLDLDDNETLVYSGDIIRVLNQQTTVTQTTQAQFYFVAGNVVNAGQKDFHEGITLTQAIFAAGGLKKDKVKKIVIRRKNEQGMMIPTAFDLKAIKDGKFADPVLQAGDTVEVEN